METPNTPAELLALQTKSTEETFEDALGDLLNDFDPEANEALSAAIRLVRGVKAIVYAQTQDTDDYLKTQWQEDYEKLKTALDLLKAVDL
jgi:hypothetical protein